MIRVVHRAERGGTAQRGEASSALWKAAKEEHWAQPGAPGTGGGGRRSPTTARQQPQAWWADLHARGARLDQVAAEVSKVRIRGADLSPADIAEQDSDEVVAAGQRRTGRSRAFEDEPPIDFTEDAFQASGDRSVYPPPRPST
ncbi:hypothetical protein V1227_10880 [Lentzea sp. DG1S-22]|uniref:hypothetical protein n=1 Tax=Lentzea sp. DG1S-22 TaxID=3108822 RepID=UPI002E7710F3|nr:hypothetical protein [Lentzea sp. DG1S-22]WVH83224.1 hypothetical protein V1227_10880 [Lentzea sp. DG1S-22]